MFHNSRLSIYTIKDILMAIQQYQKGPNHSLWIYLQMYKYRYIVCMQIDWMTLETCIISPHDQQTNQGGLNSCF